MRPRRCSSEAGGRVTDLDGLVLDFDRPRPPAKHRARTTACSTTQSSTSCGGEGHWRRSEALTALQAIALRYVMLSEQAGKQPPSDWLAVDAVIQEGARGLPPPPLGAMR
jgi:hypothetical protein